jgi:TRAP transporter TAXI family solute receptor
MFRIRKNKFVINAMGSALVALSMTAGLASAENRPEIDDSPVNVTIAGYSSGGQVSVFGEGVVEAVRRTYPGSSIIYEPGNPAGAMEYLKSERRPFALESIVEPKMAYEGRAPFRGKYPPGTVTGILNGSPDVFALKIYGRADFLNEHGVKSFADLVEKEVPMRVSINQPGNLWAREHVRALFSYFGKTMEDVEAWGGELVPQPTGASHDLMRDGRLDVIITGGATPSGRIVELGSVQDLAFVTLSEELVKHVADELGASVGSIPAGSYDFVDEELATVMSSFMIVAGPAATYEDAYKLAKSMYEQMEHYRSSHRALRKASREQLPNVSYLELHPGAKAFYQEVGLID